MKFLISFLNSLQMFSKSFLNDNFKRVGANEIPGFSFDRVWHWFQPLSIGFADSQSYCQQIQNQVILSDSKSKNSFIILNFDFLRDWTQNPSIVDNFELRRPDRQRFILNAGAQVQRTLCKIIFGLFCVNCFVLEFPTMTTMISPA